VCNHLTLQFSRRIPAPQAASSRGYPYRLAGKKRATACSEATTPLSREHQNPHQQMHDFALAEGGALGVHTTTATTFTRLAKLLHQSSAVTARANLQPPHGDNIHMEASRTTGLELGLGLREEAPRRLSWERCVCNLSATRLENRPSVLLLAMSALSTFTLTVTRSAFAIS